MTVDTLTAKPKNEASTSAAGSTGPAAEVADTVEVSAADASTATAGRTATADQPAAGEQPAAGDEPAAEDKPKRGRAKAPAAKKTKTLELTLTVTGTADGEWHAELKQGSTWIARGLPVAAAAVSRAAKELHEDLSVPIDEVIDAAREQQAAKVAALEAELEAARRTLAELAD